MSHGFLGFNSSFMLDVVVCALILVVPALAYSLYLVKMRQKFVWHRNIQVGLGVVLLITVLAFEIDLQVVHGGWRNIVEQRHPEFSEQQMEFVKKVLWVHLVFAGTTPLFWAATIFLALKRMPSPPCPCDHSPLHKKLGWISTIDITLTSITGLLFYYYAFVA